MRTNGSGIDTLVVDNQEIHDAKGKAQALSNQYYSVFTDEDVDNIPSMSGIPYPTITEIDINVKGVGKLLQNINVKKASGPDGIPSQILRDLSEELSPVIAQIFSQSLTSGELPKDWLAANITAIFKKGKKSKPANYRPVSLISVTCKLLEHIVFKHIMDHLEEYNILSSFQHGFRSNHSCESQLLITLEDLARNIDHGLQTDVLILDFQKAFDTVPHQRLIRKLDHYGIRDNILKWISNWLTSRTQRVVVDGEISKPVHVKSGVPQGTVLGPLMFLIYINNIADQTDEATHIRLFADDCLLYRVIRSSDDTEQLQRDFDSLTDWSSKWQMSFNSSKCKLLSVTTKRNPIKHTYKMADVSLETVKHHPYLGVEIAHNLKWTKHINNVTAKANNALWFIRRNLWRCPASVKQQMFFALVRPILDYASVVWDPHTISDIQQLEAIQRRAARFVTNNYKRTEGSATNILQKLDWPSLQQRRKEHRLTTMFKIHLQDIAVPIPDYIHRQPLSHNRKYHPAKFRVMKPTTNVYKYSFFPRTIIDWNDLPAPILDSHKLSTFKTSLWNS